MVFSIFYLCMCTIAKENEHYCKLTLLTNVQYFFLVNNLKCFYNSRMMHQKHRRLRKKDDKKKLQEFKMRNYKDRKKIKLDYRKNKKKRKGKKFFKNKHSIYTIKFTDIKINYFEFAVCDANLWMYLGGGHQIIIFKLLNQASLQRV